MRGLPVAQLNLQLMHATSHQLQLLYLLLYFGAKALSGGEAFVELGDVLPQDPNLLLQHLLGLFRRPTGLLGPTDFVRLRRGAGIGLLDPMVTFCEGPFQLLQRVAMHSFPVAQLNLQLMHAALGRLQPFYLSSEVVAIGDAFVELGDMLAQDADLLLQHLLGLFRRPTGLLHPTQFVRLVSND